MCMSNSSMSEDESTEARKVTAVLVAIVLFTSALSFVGIAGGYYNAYAQDTGNNNDNNLDVQVTKPAPELTIQWWQWVASIPEEENPVTDKTGEDCSQGDFGDIFFLAGTAGGRAKRECIISEGQSILIPISVGLCIKETPEETESSLNALCSAILGQPKSLELIIDGQEIGNLQDYRVKVSSFFTVDAVEGNIFGLEPGSYQAVSDGYWVLIEGGLPAGEHTIEFVGKLHGFKVAVTYEITVI
jgi:hypothetical protein